MAAFLGTPIRGRHEVFEACSDVLPPAVKRARRPQPPLGELPTAPTPNGPTAPPDSAAFIKEKLTFDGHGTNIEAPQPSCNVGGSEGLTVAAWVKRSKDESAWDRLIDFGNGQEKENLVISFQERTMYEVRNGDGVQQLAVGGSAASAEGSCCSFPPDQWMHIALVHDKDGIASIYWNGALKARGPVWLPQPVHREKYYVGRSHWSQDPYFKGEISDVHVFNYALNHRAVMMACFSRSLPRGAILSMASGWQRDAPSRFGFDVGRLPMTVPPPAARDGADGDGALEPATEACDEEHPLQFFTGLGDEYKSHALHQLQHSFQMQKELVSDLAKRQVAASARGAVREADAIADSLVLASDALRRAQAVERMIRYSMPEHNRMPTEVREHATTGQQRQPPRIAAAFDVSSGVFHAFAIYELRSASKKLPWASAAAPVFPPPPPSEARPGEARPAEARSAEASRAASPSLPAEEDMSWHVYISELINTRHLLPGHAAGRPKIGGLLVNLLQRQANADKHAVVLKPLHDAKPGAGGERLENHYAKIGFTADRSAFAEAGLSDTYHSGEYILSAAP